MKKVFEYFSSWDGWYCEVKDKDENCCGEVIGSCTKDMINHLKDEHNIETEE